MKDSPIEQLVNGPARLDNRLRSWTVPMLHASSRSKRWWDRIEESWVWVNKPSPRVPPTTRFLHHHWLPEHRSSALRLFLVSLHGILVLHYQVQDCSKPHHLRLLLLVAFVGATSHSLYLFAPFIFITCFNL